MKKLAEFYKVLGDETRLKILEMLAEQEMCVCEILDRLKISQPAVSHHLKVLRQVGLVTDSKEGKWVYYSLNFGTLEEMTRGADTKVVQHYIEYLKTLLQEVKPSGVRTDPGLCEKLTEGNKSNKKMHRKK